MNYYDLEKSHKYNVRKLKAMGEAVEKLEAKIESLKLEKDSLEKRNEQLLQTMSFKDKILGEELRKANEKNNANLEVIQELRRNIRELSK